MKILAFEVSPTTAFGGSERSYFDVLSGLSSKGHNVTLYYLKDGNLVAQYQQAGIETRKVNVSYVIRSDSRWKDLASTWRLARKFKGMKGKDTIVYLNFAEALPLAALLKVLYGCPVVCHIRIGYFGLSRQILWAGRFADRFIVINNKFQETFSRVFKAREEVKVIYNGLTIPTVLLPPVTGSVNGDLRILYLGRIAPEKGVTELVRAVSAVIARGVQASLQITGDYVMSHSGDYRAELSEAITESNMRDHVRISGPVADPLTYLRDFDLFVMPATWEEPFGRTVPEAILAGIPVLARRVGMIDEIMVDNPGFMFSSDEELREKIIEFAGGRLLFNFDTARHRVVTEFNKERMIDDVEKNLVEVCGRHDSGRHTDTA